MNPNLGNRQNTWLHRSLLLLFSALIFGCTTTTDNPADVLKGVLSDTDEQIFVGDPMEANYDPNVIMKRAESYFEKERYPEAIVEYKHFLDLHRGHVLAPYAQYKIAITHFKRFKSIDRDPEPVKESVAAFEKLLAEYPDNRYKAEAREKIKTCHEHLAEHHIFVGKFYYNKEAYLAAAHRYENVIDNYPTLAAAGDAKYQLARTYEDLGAVEWAAGWLVDFVQNHPENELFDDGMEMLAKMQEDYPEVMIAQMPNPIEEVGEDTGLGTLNAGYQNESLTTGSSSPSLLSEYAIDEKGTQLASASSGFQNTLPQNGALPSSAGLNSTPVNVAYRGSSSSMSGTPIGHSSAAVHTITEHALCSLGSWCESSPASATIAPPPTKVCRLGEWC